MINFLLWAPLAGGLLAALAPRRLSGWLGSAGAAASLVLAILLVVDFDSGQSGLQDVVNESWIPDLGVRYSLGVDGISIFLLLMTAALWGAATPFAALRDWERPGLFFLMLGLGESATLGAFLAQDLLLFVLFFDLMLIPFFFLIGTWGTESKGVSPSGATIKMIVYTLAGSLLMLVAAIATAVISTPDGGQISFSLAELRSNPMSGGNQDWVFCFFAAAFLVKMPAFLVHGWMPDAYRTCPLPALALLSGVLAKVGAYGFLRIALPVFPDAAARFQETVLLIGVAGILYGSVMAFSQTNVRLIAGYSSIAQLGFITIGIFSLRPEGADGAVLQMVNHGLVVAPLFLIVAVVAERAGTEDLRELGGFAMRAPVLAAFLLVVVLGVLAMPGSANFVGEFLILLSVFKAKIVLAFVAAVGVALAAYYALRLFQGVMHNRLPRGRRSQEVSVLDGALLGGLIACVVALALYPQLILHRADRSVEMAIEAAASPAGGAEIGGPPPASNAGGAAGGGNFRDRTRGQGA
jgi:NADH-quinone oxidoreductase subunit M